MMLISPRNEGRLQGDKWENQSKLKLEIISMNKPLSALASLLSDEVFQPNYTACRFLVVDDNEINLRIMFQVLKRLFPQSRVDTIQDSRLVDYSNLHQYQIIFLDIEMPVVTGIDIASVVRCDPSLNCVGLIAVTTKFMLNDMMLYKQTGFDYTFPKPFNLQDREILKRIEWVLEDRCGLINT